MRLCIRLLIFVGATLFILPFLVSSLLVDQRGILIPGHVVSKDERITVSYSSWTRHLEAKLQYQPPDDSSLAVLTARLGPERFDGLSKGDDVPLRYLLRRDLPNWPGFKTMRQMRVLPFVRLAGESTWTGPKDLINAHWQALTVVLVIGLTLLLWRWLRLPGFIWAFAASVLLGMTASYIGMFPRAMRAPRQGVRTAAGTVKSLDHWRFLFRTAHDRSRINWLAAQPIAVAGIEFVPQGKTDPVVAVDLIDDGSVPGLAEHSVVNVDYESASPRAAYIRGATRRFAARNLQGLISQLFWMTIVTVVLWGIARLFGLWVRKLMRPTRP